MRGNEIFFLIELISFFRARKEKNVRGLKSLHANRRRHEHRIAALKIRRGVTFVRVNRDSSALGGSEETKEREKTERQRKSEGTKDEVLRSDMLAPVLVSPCLVGISEDFRVGSLFSSFRFPLEGTSIFLAVFNTVTWRDSGWIWDPTIVNWDATIFLYAKKRINLCGNIWNIFTYF